MKKRILSLALLVLLLVFFSGCNDVDAPITQELCDGTHTDVNDNGQCDYCHKSVMTTFDLYAINDLHGKFVDGDNHPGVDELTTYLKKAALTDDNVILLSAGDMWQGSSESNLTSGLLITDWMNRLDFAAMALGNHEFDWGEDAIAANAALAEFPLLAINIYDRTTNTLVDYCQGSTVVEFDGIQVGIIGAIGDCYSSIAQDKVADVYFKTGRELTALVKAESERLRGEGVDFVVYCLHDGYGQSGATPTTSPSSNQIASYYDVSLSDGYVDLVFEGHTHQQYVIRDQYGVYHLQNRGDNKGGISHVEVSINTVTGSFSVNQRAVLSHAVYTNMTDDPMIELLLDKYSEQIQQANRVVGTNGTYRNSDYLCQKVAQLYYEAGLACWGDEYDIVLGGGFISARSPYSLKEGQVLYGQLQSIFPFDNDIVLCSVRGSDLLRRFINNSDDRYQIFGDPEAMNNIDPNGTYYIVVDTFTSAYTYNNLTVVEEYEKGIYARDLLADFIENGGMQ